MNATTPLAAARRAPSRPATQRISGLAFAAATVLTAAVAATAIGGGLVDNVAADSAAGGWGLGLGIVGEVLAAAVLVACRRDADVWPGRLGSAGTWLTAGGLVAMAVGGVATLVTGDHEALGLVYVAGALLSFVGAVLLAVAQLARAGAATGTHGAVRGCVRTLAAAGRRPAGSGRPDLAGSPVRPLLRHYRRAVPAPSADDEEPLALGGVTHVVRVADTVRRPVRPFTASVQAYLSHLRDQGFTGAPEPLGYDEQGREVLSYVAGQVPVEPLPEWATSAQVLVALAQLVRRLHDAAQDWTPPRDAAWGSIPGAPQAGVVPLFDVPELVSHQDYCPGNVVFRDGLPAALIDFDLARPTTRVADAVNAMYWWVPLLDPIDRAPALVDADAADRVRLFADAYGMDAAQRAEVVSVAVRRAANASVTMRAAAEVDPVFRRWWEDGVKDRMPRAERWIARNASQLHERLLGD